MKSSLASGQESPQKLSLSYLNEQRFKLLMIIGPLIERLPNKAEILKKALSARIIISKTMRTTLGRVNYRENRIYMNKTLMDRYPEEIDPTFAHELAHILAPLIYGASGRGHKRGWKKTMLNLGFPPERLGGSHIQAEDLRRRHKVQAIAKCACREFQIKPRRYRSMLEGTIYRCRSCKQSLVLVD